MTPSGVVELDEAGSAQDWALSFGTAVRFSPANVLRTVFFRSYSCPVLKYQRWPQARTDLLGLHERWYKARLFDDDDGDPDGKSIDDEPPIQLFVMGEGANEWRGEQEWPLPQTIWRSCFLQPDASLRWEAPPGTTAAAASDGGVPPARLSYEYDPRDPCPSLGAQFQVRHCLPACLPACPPACL